jgi:hypothetical protein
MNYSSQKPSSKSSIHCSTSGRIKKEIMERVLKLALGLKTGLKSGEMPVYEEVT